MAISLAEVVGRFKAEVGRALSAEVIEGVCRDLGHAFRRRLLDPVVLIHSFLLQILHGNVACSALPHLTGRLFSAAAYVRARARLPLALFWELLRRVVAGLWAERSAPRLLPRPRTWLLAGSRFPLPHLSPFP